MEERIRGHLPLKGECVQLMSNIFQRAASGVENWIGVV